jgi:hypothetical protein
MSAAKEIVAALKAKGMTPREVAKALGLDEALLTRENIMNRPTRLAAVSLAVIKRATEPLLAMDAKVEFMPVVADLTTKNFKPKLVVDRLRKVIRGKTIAKDADLGHVETALKMLEKPHEPGKELPGTLDESVSAEQHKAMEAAAHGQSNLGIPKDVGEEFAEADKGKSFDAVFDYLRGKGFGDDDIEHLKGMMPESAMGAAAHDVHHYHGARDESEAEEARREREKAAEDRHPAGKDAQHHHHYASDEETERKKREAKEAEDRGARDKMVTKDEMTREVSAAVARERQNQAEVRVALDEAIPLVGKLRSDLAFDSADAVRRHVLKARGKSIEGVNSAGLKLAVAMLEPINARPKAPGDAHLGMDETQLSDFNTLFPGAARIGTA